MASFAARPAWTRGVRVRAPIVREVCPLPADPALHARWRIVAAFALAPLAGAFAFACWEPFTVGDSPTERVLGTTVVAALVGGYPAILLLGVPTFFVLRPLVRPSALNCAMTGTIVASLPWLLLALVSNPHEAFSGGHVTVHDGMKTWWGWLEALGIVGEAAIFGTLAGLVFWLVAAAGPRRTG